MIVRGVMATMRNVSSLRIEDLQKGANNHTNHNGVLPFLVNIEGKQMLPASPLDIMQPPKLVGRLNSALLVPMLNFSGQNND